MAQSLASKSWRARRLPGPIVISPRRSIDTKSLAGLVAFLVVSAAIAGGLTGMVNTPLPRDEPARTEEDFRVGAIMYVPVKGAICEIHRFDNATGRVVPDGYINCERKLTPDGANAYAQGTERNERMRAVLQSFRK